MHDQFPISSNGFRWKVLLSNDLSAAENIPITKEYWLELKCGWLLLTTKQLRKSYLGRKAMGFTYLHTFFVDQNSKILEFLWLVYFKFLSTYKSISSI